MTEETDKNRLEKKKKKKANGNDPSSVHSGLSKR